VVSPTAHAAEFSANGDHRNGGKTDNSALEVPRAATKKENFKEVI